MYYDEDEGYNAYDDYDRYRHTGELSEWFEDEPKEDEDTLDDYCDDAVPCDERQMERENKKVRYGCAGCLLLALIIFTITAIIITRY